MSKGRALRNILSVFPMDIAPVMNASLNSTLANTCLLFLLICNGPGAPYLTVSLKVNT